MINKQGKLSAPHFFLGSLHWQHSGLVFEKKGLIPELQRLLTEQTG